MNKKLNTIRATPRPRPETHRPASGAPKAAAGWRPQPCGISREEMRKIVAEMIG